MNISRHLLTIDLANVEMHHSLIIYVWGQSCSLLLCRFLLTIDFHTSMAAEGCLFEATLPRKGGNFADFLYAAIQTRGA